MLENNYLKITSGPALALLTITLLLLIASSFSTQSSLETQSCTNEIGRFWDQSQCSDCQENCGCSTYNGCDYCKPTMYYNTIHNKCEDCETGCSSCCMRQSLTKVICTACDTGYTLISGSCVSSAGCKTYISNTNKCLACSDGFYLDNTLQCQACDVTCATCSTKYDCITCTAGKYYPSPSFPSICLKCTCGDNCNTSGTCVTTTVVTPTDLCASSTINFCSYQLYDYAEQQCKCETCIAGYYVLRSAVTGFTCETCGANAARCLSGEVILECDVDATKTTYYILDISTNACVDNTKLNCRRMYKGNCSDCNDGYYSEADSTLGKTGCYIKKANCAENSQKGTVCLTCDTGYYLSATNTCTLCNNTNYPKCSECSSPDGVCTKCETKYRLSSENKCESCLDEHCATCTSSTRDCTTCDKGYGLNTDDAVTKCLKCAAGCDICDEEFRKCTACSEGYYNINFTCVPIPANCIIELNGFCILCESKYIAQDGFCQMCENPTSGLYFCPSACKDEEITVLMQLSSSIQKPTLFMFGMLLLLASAF